MPVVTLSGVYFPDNNYFVGPVEINSKYYLVLRDNSSLSKLVVVESNDPENVWTKKASFDVGVTGNLESWWIEERDDFIYIAAATHDGNTSNPKGGIHHLVYDALADSFVSSVVVSNINKNAPYHELVSCSLALRTNGYPVILYNGQMDRVHGKFYERVYYAYYDGSIWHTDIPIDNGGQNNWVGSIAKSGDDNRVHFVFRNLDTFDIYQRTLRSNNSLESFPSAFDQVGQPPHIVGRGISYTVGSITKVKIPYRNSNSRISILEFDSSDTPTLTIDPSVTDHAVKPFSSSVVEGLTNDGNNLYLVYGDLQNTGMYLGENMGGSGWGTDTLEMTLSALQGISCNVYNRSGIKVGVAYLDGQSVKYTELT